LPPPAMPPFTPPMLIFSWIFFAFGSVVLSISLIVRIAKRLDPAKQRAIQTYDRWRQDRKSKDEATTAAFMAQAYHICTAFDLLCFPCWALGLCRDSEPAYTQFDEEYGTAYAKRTPSGKGSGRSFPTGTSRGTVKSNRKMFEKGQGHIMPINYDPPQTDVKPFPEKRLLELTMQKLASSSPAPGVPSAAPHAASEPGAALPAAGAPGVAPPAAGLPSDSPLAAPAAAPPATTAASLPAAPVAPAAAPPAEPMPPTPEPALQA